METNNQPITVIGLPYLWSYAGVLNIVEELLDVTIIIFMAISGFSLRADLLCGMAVVAAVHTAVFMFLHTKGVIRRSKLSWHWIECGAFLTVAVLMAILSTAVLAVFVKGYIITGLMGYFTSMVYFFDTFYKYQIAVTPVPKYAWTTPNMPDLN